MSCFVSESLKQDQKSTRYHYHSISNNGYRQNNDSMILTDLCLLNTNSHTPNIERLMLGKLGRIRQFSHWDTTSCNLVFCFMCFLNKVPSLAVSQPKNSIYSCIFTSWLQLNTFFLFYLTHLPWGNKKIKAKDWKWN